MVNKITQWQTTTLLAVCISAGMVPAASATYPVLYQLHSSGSVWGYTGVPCHQNVCSGWILLNNDPNASQIAAGSNGNLYQLDNNGSVWQWIGTPGCSGNDCIRWRQVGVKATQIWAAGGNVFEYSGALYQFNGQPCSNPTTCNGWTLIDSDDTAEAYYFQDYTILKLTSDIYSDLQWFSQNTWTPYAWSGWSTFGTAPFGAGPPLALAPGLAAWYEVGSAGDTSVYGSPCSNGSCTWKQIGDNTNTMQITAGNGMYQLQSNGSVWQYDGTPCSGVNCNGWLELDFNPAIASIIAGQNTVYEKHNNGSIWQFTGPACGTVGGCPGWVELDNNSLTVSVVPGY